MNIQKLRKKIRRLQSDKKAVSPVISTIIIVAIAIAISIAVALYLTGITGTFTKFERLDVTSSYADPQNVTSGGGNPITFVVKNSGTSVITIDSIIVNGKPSNLYVGWVVSGTPQTGTTSTTYANQTVPKTGILVDGTGSAGKTISIAQGDSGTVYAFITGGKSGQSLELTMHTVSGKEYPKVVVLP